MTAMRKLKMIIGALLLTVSASAEDYPYMSFQTTDGEIVSVGVESLTMNFADGKLLLQNVDGSKEFALTDLSRMFFSSSATTISSIEANCGNGKKRVYTLSGIYIGEFSSLREIEETVANGMYLVKDNNNTTKIAVR